MAVRRVTHTYRSVVDFIEDHHGTLGQGALLLPPQPNQEELSLELKLDLVIPPLGRLGPIAAQVVNRAPDGSVALRIAEWPDSVKARITELLVAVDDLRQWLVDTGQLQPPGAVGAAPGAASPAEPGQAAVAAPAPSAPRGRGFPVPDLRGVAPTRAGSCDAASVRKLFLDLAIERATGLLTWSLPDGRKRYGFWSQGGPVGWRTEPMDEGEVLGVLLFKADQLTREQLRESLEIMQRDGCRQGEAFIQMGLMSFPQLVMVLGKQCEFVMQKVLKESQGSWTFHALETLPERFLPSPLRVPAMIFRNLFQQARSMKGDSLYEALAGYLDQYVYLPPGCVEILPELRFAPVEARLVDTIRSGSWRMRELYAVSPMSRAITAAMMWALIQLEFVAFKTQQDDSRAFAALQIIIDRKKSQVYKGNHFEVLEVHWICLTEEVEIAYKRLKEEFEPSRYARMGEPAVTDVAKINLKLDEAYQVLRDDRTRREYRKAVIEDSKIVQSAELLGRQGEMAEMRKDRRAASMAYGKALELVPGSAEYRGGLTRARSLPG
ncbi:J domain-containing protein [Myxococcota bacterium]|nr:J domain-containing protein [Myxococcota bacterium]